MAEAGDEFATPSAGIQRDRWGRPMILPVGEPQAVPYQRCTRFIDCLDDSYNLTQWKQRMTAIGIATRPDLVLAASAARNDKPALNGICKQAMDAAASSAAANIGTALHALLENIDKGIDVGPVPAAYEADLVAYQRAMEPFRIVGIERFSVNDDLRVAGTHDRTVEFEGVHYIADLKTGSIEYGALKIAMQLAVYAHSDLYDPEMEERSPLVVDQSRALVMHLPAGSGQCTLHWADIAAGWEAVQVAVQVWAWRKRKHLMTPFSTTSAATPEPDPTAPGFRGGEPDELGYQIMTARTAQDLAALWTANQDRWVERHTIMAKVRKAELAAS